MYFELDIIEKSLSRTVGAALWNMMHDLHLTKENNFCWPAFSLVFRDEIEADPTFDVTFRILYLTSVSRGNSLDLRRDTYRSWLSTLLCPFPSIILPYCLRKHVSPSFRRHIDSEKHREEAKTQSLSWTFRYFGRHKLGRFVSVDKDWS